MVKTDAYCQVFNSADKYSVGACSTPCPAQGNWALVFLLKHQADNPYNISDQKYQVSTLNGE